MLSSPGNSRSWACMWSQAGSQPYSPLPPPASAGVLTWFRHSSSCSDPEFLSRSQNALLHPPGLPPWNQSPFLCGSIGDNYSWVDSFVGGKQRNKTNHKATFWTTATEKIRGTAPDSTSRYVQKYTAWPKRESANQRTKLQQPHQNAPQLAVCSVRLTGGQVGPSEVVEEARRVSVLPQESDQIAEASDSREKRHGQHVLLFRRRPRCARLRCRSCRPTRAPQGSCESPACCGSGFYWCEYIRLQTTSCF